MISKYHLTFGVWTTYERHELIIHNNIQTNGKSIGSK